MGADQRVFALALHEFLFGKLHAFEVFITLGAGIGFTVDDAYPL